MLPALPLVSLRLRPRRVAQDLGIRLTVFTRTGVFTTPELHLYVVKEFRMLIGVIVGIMLWETVEDAGMDSHRDNNYVFVEKHGLFRIDKVLCDRTCVYGRATFAAGLMRIDNPNSIISLSSSTLSGGAVVHPTNRTCGATKTSDGKRKSSNTDYLRRSLRLSQKHSSFLSPTPEESDLGESYASST